MQLQGAELQKDIWGFFGSLPLLKDIEILIFKTYFKKKLSLIMIRNMLTFINVV